MVSKSKRVTKLHLTNFGFWFSIQRCIEQHNDVLHFQSSTCAKFNWIQFKVNCVRWTVNWQYCNFMLIGCAYKKGLLHLSVPTSSSKTLPILKQLCLSLKQNSFLNGHIKLFWKYPTAERLKKGQQSRVTILRRLSLKWW